MVVSMLHNLQTKSINVQTIVMNDDTSTTAKTRNVVPIITGRTWNQRYGTTCFDKAKCISIHSEKEDPSILQYNKHSTLERNQSREGTTQEKDESLYNLSTVNDTHEIPLSPTMSFISTPADGNFAFITFHLENTDIGFCYLLSHNFTNQT